MNKGIVSRIQTVVDHLEISVSAFADEIGVQRSSMSHLLNGRNKPSLDFVMKLVDTYPEVDLYWLLQGKGKFPADETEIVQQQETINTFKQEVDSSPDSMETADKPSKTQKSIRPVGTNDPERIIFFYADGTFTTFHSKKD